MSLDGRKSTLGEAHPVTKQSLNNLAMLLKVKEKQMAKLRSGKSADSGVIVSSETANTVRAEQISIPTAEGIPPKRGSISNKNHSTVGNGSGKGKSSIKDKSR